MDDLVLWLREQVDEDERVARRAAGRLPGADRWVAGESNEDGVRSEAGTPVTRFSWPYEMDYIARHDPAQVLAEVQAKRLLIEEHAELDPPFDPADEDWPRVCRRCEDRSRHDAMRWPCTTLRLLASMYARRPGYREEWSPDARVGHH